MVDDFGGTTVSIEDLRAGYAQDLLAEADVIVAVDAGTGEEEVLHGREESGRAIETGSADDLDILRVELAADTDDPGWLEDAIESIHNGEDDEWNDSDD